MNFREFFEAATETDLVPFIPKLPKGQRPELPQGHENPYGAVPQKRLRKLGQYANTAGVKTDVEGNPISGQVFPNQTLAIPRRDMPQVKDRSDFVQWLLVQGIPVKPFVASARDLVGTAKEPKLAFAQSAMNVEKAQKFLTKGTVFKKAIVLSQENIIFDGNHHWLALKLGYPNQPVTMWKVMMPFQQLKDLSKEYPGVTYEEAFDYNG